MQLKTLCLCLSQTYKQHISLFSCLQARYNFFFFRLIYLFFEAKVSQTSVSVLKKNTKPKKNTEVHLTV